MIPMLDLKRVHAELEEELKRAFDETLNSGGFIQGPAVTKFEESLAAHCTVSSAIGVSSGTDALLVAMMALGVKPGDEVITTPFTFFATAGCVSRLGARPVFVDIEYDSFNIDVTKISEAVTERTVGIIPVHLFGHCADMDPIIELSKTKGLWVIEDAAQSIGSEYKGRNAGSMGRLGTYSFFPAKNLGALGDGGAVVTNHADLADRVRSLRQHGSRTKYCHQEVGGNFRLDALQAAFLSVKLPHLKKWEEGRRRVAAAYKEGLGDIETLVLPNELPGCRHVFNQYVIRSKKRDHLKKAMDEAGIGSAIYYPNPLHLQKCFEDLGYKSGDLPVSEQASKEVLALPVDPLLDDESLEKIIETVREHGS